MDISGLLRQKAICTAIVKKVLQFATGRTRRGEFGGQIFGYRRSRTGISVVRKLSSL